MLKSTTSDPQELHVVVKHMFNAFPLMRKRLMNTDTIQSEHGIPMSHVQVLVILNEHSSLSVSEISQRLGIAKPNITPLVDRLIDMELVDRRRDQNDRRVVNVAILPKGQEKLHAIQTTLVNYIQAQKLSLTSADLLALADSLQTITRILSLM